MGLTIIFRIALRYSDVVNRMDKPLEVDTETDTPEDGSEGRAGSSNRGSPAV